MMALLWMVIVGTTIWMGFDATERDFSQSKFARSTAQWVIGGLGLWIVAFPAYLVLRQRVPLKGAPRRPAVDPWATTTSVAPPSHSVPPPSLPERPEPR